MMDRLNTMKKPFAVIASLLLLMALAVPALAHDPAPGPFYDTWARTDKPVADGIVDRTFIWGPDALEDPRMEQYAESPGGMRQVQYYEKARMEINNPNAANDGLWYVTNGLLVVELMTGRMQVGDNAFVDGQPADINIAGDPGYAETPTYATYASLMDAMPWPQGAVITATVAADGTVGDAPGQAQYNITAGPLSPETGHRTASVFWDFMVSMGPVHQNGQTVNEPLFLNPYYATGLPVTEAYWAEIMVAGTPRWVMTQAFERRVLTYTPGNPDGWLVEAGNVGWHYWQWRYGRDGVINDQFFYAELTTDQEVPQPFVMTVANGDAVVYVNGDGTLSYEIIVVDIQNVTAAHIHLGMPGETGPVVVTLFMGNFNTPPGDTATLVTGEITAADLEGPLAGMALDELLHEMAHGNTYINVHTTQNPAGEIRGQLELVDQ